MSESYDHARGREPLSPFELEHIIVGLEARISFLERSRDRIYYELNAVINQLEEVMENNVKRGRGRPKMEVGTVRTRKNGTFVKGEDGKWHPMNNEVKIKTTTVTVGHK